MRPSARIAPTPGITVAVITTLLAVCAAVGAIALSGTKTGAVLAAAAVLGPIAAVAALTSPLIFPFGLFILLVPFDNVLAFSAFGTVTRLVAILSGASIVLWLLRTRRTVAPDRVTLWWIAFLAWIVASLTWAIDPSVAYAHLFTFAQLLALYLALSFMPIDMRTLVRLVAIVVLSGTIAAAYGAYLFHHGSDISVNGRLFITNDETTIDPNQFAAALILPFSLALMTFVSSTRWAVRIGAIVCILLLGLGIAVAGSRGGLLAVAATFIYLFIRSHKRLTIALVGLGGLGGALAMYGNVLSRFSTAGSTGGAGRFDIWKVGVAALRDHAIVGAGFSNFPLAFDQSFLSVTQAYYTHWHRAPHNMLLSTAVELGVIGLAIYLGAWWYEGRSLRVVTPADGLYSLRLALEGALVGIFVASLFLDILNAKYLWLAFILIALTRNAALGARELWRTNPS